MAQPNRIKEIEIKRKMNSYIRNKILLGNKKIGLNDDDSFLERGLIDSTGVLEMVNFIEETFGLSIEDEELIPDNLDSINKLTYFITKKLRYVNK